MKLLILVLCGLIISANAYFAPIKDQLQSASLIRSPRAVEPTKGDLDGSESAYVVYPYLSYPHFYHTPVVYLGK